VRISNRAILEGMAYRIMAGYEAIHKQTGVTLSVIRVSGGGSQSDMLLAIFGRRFRYTAVPHTKSVKQAPWGGHMRRGGCGSAA
jgi:sugar (pentulose or hexulose) kinase